MASKILGKVTHWYDKIGVAVIKLAGGLKVGDRIKVAKDESEFEDSVVSMQLDHEPVPAGKKGQEVAVKLSQPTKEGAIISKIPYGKAE